MIVESTAPGRGAFGEPVTLLGISGEHSLRSLLRFLVEHEVGLYVAHRERSATLQILTPADLVKGVETGRYGHEPRALPASPVIDGAYARAVEAFDDELYFVFLDDVRIHALDDIIVVEPHSRLRLVRLVALTG
ncbi:MULTISPECIES: hypothetical protein [unclassified Microbacterium]|uniref:hypothetical protein n=1 Tax=unclassified Microbacterium TaxID=2609290 RepID=UPI000CFC4F57|nr:MULTISPECIES: hypothetical protein [unclassified Microbacterium]PRB05932.1 hypothetical protein CQ047_15330 [Microbacterium sp. MYb72]